MLLTIILFVLLGLSIALNCILWGIAKELKQEILQNGYTTIYTADDSAE